MIKINTAKDARFNMSVLNPDQRATINRISKFAAGGLSHYPVLLCLVTGPQLPKYCVAMPRSPRPLTGTEFDDHFHDYYTAQIKEAPALHDGAIVLSRSAASSPYRLAGWSYRLTAPYQSPNAEVNRGSAYNSAISMSLVDGVDFVAIVMATGVEFYCRGEKLPSS